MFASILASVLALPLLALGAPAPSPVALEARGGGNGARFTFYDTSVGLGACGVWHGNDEMTVALNSADLAAWGGGYPSAACGQMIWVEYNGNSVQASIQDECPTCSSGQLDLSMGLFSKLADQSEGVVYGNWGYVDDSW